MGKKKNREMQFWTKEEYLKFAEVMMDKPLSFYAFEMLYWCGIREGELLALTPADFDFEKRTVSITKSYQRLNGQDLITTPKTEKSNRVIQMPQFLVDEIQDYLKQLYNIQSNNRMFTVTKSYLHHERKPISSAYASMICDTRTSRCSSTWASPQLLLRIVSVTKALTSPITTHTFFLPSSWRWLTN